MSRSPVAPAMAARACSFCGAALPAGATFCPSCGAGVPGAPSAAPGFAGGPTAPAYGTPPGAFVGPAPSPATRSTDVGALQRIELAAILAVVASAIGLVFDVVGRPSSLVGVSRTASGTTISLPSPWLWIALVGAAAAVEFAVILLIRASFSDQARVDRRFETPATLAIVALIALIVLLGGFGLLLDALYRAVACSGAGNPLLARCFPAGTFLLGLGLILIGLICYVVGFIGIMIGIWRFGTRYSDGLFKAGAILLIFPVLNIVGAILILVAARAARRRIGEVGPPTVPFAPT